jgi:hypothetical protein
MQNSRSQERNPELFGDFKKEWATYKNIQEINSGW